jgi:hypothetical protein
LTTPRSAYPLDIRKNQKTHKRPAGEKPYSVFDEIDEVATDVGVRDLARNHDHYLYGAPKR